ncbi:MAG TPA: glycosyltransferase family 4 protein [Verrucomicrobiae bacterium]|nr:glycosyltransferase family 4 protein [Verrucomicrobiae bacterium]
MNGSNSGRGTPVLLAVRELGLGGSERQAAETALALDRAHFAPHVACFRSGGFRARELAEAGVPILDLGLRSLIAPSMLASAARLGRYLTRHRIQLVHAFDVPSNLFAVPVARWNRVPAVLSSQRAHRELTTGLTRHLLRLTDRIVDGIVVNSRAVARELAADDGVPGSMIRLAYNGLDTGVFRRDGPRAPLPWSGDEPVVGVVSALRPEKGLPVLLDALARTRGAKLLIVGSGPVLPELEARAREQDLGSDCHFQPAVPNVAEWLRAMDVFVLPSLSEALSNSLLEAMGCGCCPIASDAGGNAELVTDGETGLLFPAGDTEALAACLRRVLSDAGLRRRLAAAAGERARTMFAREIAAARMGAIYREFLGESAPAARDRPGGLPHRDSS